MSQFECPVVRVRIEAHPNADAIEIARVGDFQSIVRKGQFQDGDLAVYLPEAALLPEPMLKQLGMWDEVNGRGKLSGAAGNRVKAIKLRGTTSQGIVLALEACHLHREGDDLAEFLGVTKYEPVVPAHMAGKALGANLEITHKYDFENIKKNPDLFIDGEDVAITEKIHGTLLQVIVVPESMADDKFYGRRVAITSKGLGGRGIILDHNDDSNVYAQAVKKHGILDGAMDILGAIADEHDQPVLLFGEVFGMGIQDLGYGSVLDFRAFDICVGTRDRAEFFANDEFIALCLALKVNRVPLLYAGPFSRDVLLAHTDGKSTLYGGHIREGVVVKSLHEDRHARYGRKIAKSISDAYLMRKGEVTEYQ